MVARTAIPFDSVVRGMQVQADYWDAFEVKTATQPPSALHAYLAFSARTPKWIDTLMAVRNAAVRLLALKDVGRIANVPSQSAAGRLAVGDRVGIFTIRSLCNQELVLEITDSHLDVVVSVYKHMDATNRIVVSTLVFYHNWIGRLYMVPVAPMHRIVVRSVLSNQVAWQPAP